MACEEVSRVDIAEVNRRWQVGQSAAHSGGGGTVERHCTKVPGGGTEGGGRPGWTGSHGGAAEPAGAGEPRRPPADTYAH